MAAATLSATASPAPSATASPAAPTTVSVVSSAPPSETNGPLPLWMAGIAYQVFDYLTPSDLIMAACVSHAWRDALDDLSLWRRAYLMADIDKTDKALALQRAAAGDCVDWKRLCEAYARTEHRWNAGRFKAYSFTDSGALNGQYLSNLLPDRIDGRMGIISSDEYAGTLMYTSFTDDQPLWLLRDAHFLQRDNLRMSLQGQLGFGVVDRQLAMDSPKLVGHVAVYAGFKHKREVWIPAGAFARLGLDADALAALPCTCCTAAWRDVHHEPNPETDEDHHARRARIHGGFLHLACLDPVGLAVMAVDVVPGAGPGGAPGFALTLAQFGVLRANGVSKNLTVTMYTFQGGNREEVTIMLPRAPFRDPQNVDLLPDSPRVRGCAVISDKLLIMSTEAIHQDMIDFHGITRLQSIQIYSRAGDHVFELLLRPGVVYDLTLAHEDDKDPALRQVERLNIPGRPPTADEVTSFCSIFFPVLFQRTRHHLVFSVRAPADEHGFDGGVRFAMVIIPHFERVFAGALAIQEEAMRQRYLSSHTLCVMTAEFGRTSRDHIGMYGDRVLLGMSAFNLSSRFALFTSFPALPLSAAQRLGFTPMPPLEVLLLPRAPSRPPSYIFMDERAIYQTSDCWMSGPHVLSFDPTWPPEGIASQYSWEPNEPGPVLGTSRRCWPFRHLYRRLFHR